jgi:hypothetical protein
VWRYSLPFFSRTVRTRMSPIRLKLTLAWFREAICHRWQIRAVGQKPRVVTGGPDDEVLRYRSRLLSWGNIGRQRYIAWKPKTHP